IGISLQQLKDDAEIIVGVEESRRQLYGLLEQFDRAIQPALLLFLESLFIILNGFLRKILSHLADVDDVWVGTLETRRALTDLNGRLVEEDRNARASERIENLHQLVDRLVAF